MHSRGLTACSSASFAWVSADRIIDDLRAAGAPVRQLRLAHVAEMRPLPVVEGYPHPPASFAGRCRSAAAAPLSDSEPQGTRTAAAVCRSDLLGGHSHPNNLQILV